MNLATQDRSAVPGDTGEVGSARGESVRHCEVGSARGSAHRYPPVGTESHAFPTGRPRRPGPTLVADCGSSPAALAIRARHRRSAPSVTTFYQHDVLTNKARSYSRDQQVPPAASTVGETGTAALADCGPVLLRSDSQVGVGVPADWRERFSTAYDAELREWIDAVAAGRWDFAAGALRPDPQGAAVVMRVTVEELKALMTTQPPPTKSLP